jgi:hypothetical protein
MDENKRRSYVGTLQFRTLNELRIRLCEVQDAIDQKKSNPGRWYFERLALKSEIEKRGSNEELVDKIVEITDELKMHSNEKERFKYMETLRSASADQLQRTFERVSMIKRMQRRS